MSLAVCTLIFLPVPLIGTLVHECGHAGVACLLGYNPTVHFGSTDWTAAGEAMRSGSDDLAIRLGGPCMDMLVGTAGLIWLARARRDVRRDAPLGSCGWLAALMALFWSRPVFVALRLFAALATGQDFHRLDEVRLAEHFGLPVWLIASGTGMLGAAVCTVIVARYVPARTAVPFALGGVIGSLSGFAVWHGWLGPLLLP